MKYPETASLASLARNSASMTQEVFCATYSIPITTFRNWEQGRAEARNRNEILLRLIIENAALIRDLLEKIHK